MKPVTSNAPTSPRRADGPPAQYVLKPPPLSQEGRVVELKDGKLGVLIGSRRAVVDPRGLWPEVAKDDVAVQRTVALPGDGGFLFFTGMGLGRAKTFLDPIEPLITGDIEHAWIGPGFVLARKSEGQTVAVDLATGQPKKNLPFGLAVVATSPSVSIGLTQGGAVLRSTDGGATWKDASKELTWTPTNVVTINGSVIVTSSQNNVAARAEPGRFVPATMPRPKTRPVESGWSSNVSPIEAAVARGAPVDAERAIVAEAGSVFVVSTRSGAILEREAGVLPPDRQCETVRLSKSVLFLCPSYQITSVFRRDEGDGKTVLEQTLPSVALFHRGRGDSLLFAGPCSGQPRVAAACVRHADGTWHDLERPELRDTPQGQPAPNIVTWIPDGEGALVLLAAPNGGILDMKTGERSKLEDSRVNELVSHLRPSGSVLVERFGVNPAGEIVGFGQNQVGVRIAKGGKEIAQSPFRFSAADAAGPLVLASSGDRLWQSNDWGFTFREVATPPLPTSATTPSCSATGCALYEWLRVGWDARPPVKDPPQAGVVGVSAPPEAAQKLPALRCSSTAAPVRKLATPRQGEERAGFGAEMIKIGPTSYFGVFPRGLTGGSTGNNEAANLRAFITGTRPEVLPDGGVSLTTGPRRVRTLLPFDPKGTIVDGSVKIAELIDVARAVGGAIPDMSQPEDRGYALTVGGETTSVLLAGMPGPLLWVRPKGPPVPLSLGANLADFAVVSATQTGPDEVSVLLEDYLGTTSVRRLGRGRAEESFTLPPWPDQAPPITPDSLAIGPDGKLAVIRVTTRSAPTDEQPALLLAPGVAPVRLAAWATATADGAPGCEGATGYRAVIGMPASWITSGIPSDGGIEPIGFAKVRWGIDRVCIEAVELSANAYDLPNGQAASYVVARFGKDPAAGHLFMAEGSELREPRTCSLEPAAR